MNGDAAINIIMQRLGNRSDTELRTNVLAEMVLTQSTTLEQSVLLPWFLVTDTNVAPANLTWTANSERVALPTNFIGFDDDLQCGVWLQDVLDTSSDPWLALARRPYVSLKAFSKNVDDDSTDTPYAFDILNGYLYLRPIQTANQTLRLIYLAADTAPTDTAAENLWLKHAPDLVIAETGIVMAQNYILDQEMVAGFNDQRAIALARLHARNESMKHSLQNYTMGD